MPGGQGISRPSSRRVTPAIIAAPGAFVFTAAVAGRYRIYGWGPGGLCGSSSFGAASSGGYGYMDGRMIKGDQVTGIIGGLQSDNSITDTTITAFGRTATAGKGSNGVDYYSSMLLPGGLATGFDVNMQGGGVTYNGSGNTTGLAGGGGYGGVGGLGRGGGAPSTSALIRGGNGGEGARIPGHWPGGGAGQPGNVTPGGEGGLLIEYLRP